MLMVTVWGVSFSGVTQAAAAIDGGSSRVVTPSDGSGGAGQPLASGASATPFSLLLPAGAACTGDSALGGYRVQSYIVPESVAPASLTFDSAGPMPSGLGASFRQPLFESTGSGYVNAQTANATVTGGPGPVVNIPAFKLGPPDVFVPGDIPAGTYNVGIACTKGPASATQIDKFWNTQMTVTTAPADLPAGVTWTSSSVVTTTTTASSTTTTVVGGSTTSTTGGSTTTTTTGASTTSTTTSGATTSTTSGVLAGGGAPTGTPVVSSVASLPVTGGSTTSLVVWSVLLLVFGRMAILLGRPPRVKALRT